MFGLRSICKVGTQRACGISLVQTRCNQTSAVLDRFKNSTNGTGNKSQPSLRTPPSISQVARKTKNDLSASDARGSPKAYARTVAIKGPIAGRIVSVPQGNIDSAFRSLKYLVNSNNIRLDKNAQRFYKKPSKVLEEKRMRRKNKLFDQGIRRLVDIVKDAKRRGY